MSQLATALDQIKTARRYTLGLLADLPDEAWFWMPTPAVSHIAWQVGHLAIAQYRMVVAFHREPRESDNEWAPDSYRPLFGRDSIPQPDPALYPTPAELLATLNAINDNVTAEAAAYAEADLQGPVLVPHRFLKTRMEALLWCSRHESIHAGQIGLLRRLYGLSPQW